MGGPLLSYIEVLEMNQPFVGIIENALIFKRCLTSDDTKALVRGDIDRLGFLPIQIERDVASIPSNSDEQST